MIVQRKTHRRRIVKGYAFMNLGSEETRKIEQFLETGDTNYLPQMYKNIADVVVKEKLPRWAD